MLTPENDLDLKINFRKIETFWVPTNLIVAVRLFNFTRKTRNELIQRVFLEGGGEFEVFEVFVVA